MPPLEVDISVSPNSDGENVIIEAGAIAAAFVNSTPPAALLNLELSNAVANNSMAAQNAVTNQRAISQVGLTAVGKAVQMVSTLTPMQSRTAQEILTGNVVAEQTASESAVTPIPIPPPIPPIIPPGTVYANIPLHLVYDNDAGMENVVSIIVNGVQNPIPSGEVFAVAPVHLSYDNEDGLVNITVDPVPLTKATK